MPRYSPHHLFVVVFFSSLSFPSLLSFFFCFALLLFCFLLFFCIFTDVLVVEKNRTVQAHRRSDIAEYPLAERFRDPLNFVSVIGRDGQSPCKGAVEGVVRYVSWKTFISTRRTYFQTFQYFVSLSLSLSPVKDDLPTTKNIYPRLYKRAGKYVDRIRIGPIPESEESLPLLREAWTRCSSYIIVALPSSNQESPSAELFSLPAATKTDLVR